jgi:TRAP-type transport system periplasmic protein
MVVTQVCSPGMRRFKSQSREAAVRILQVVCIVVVVTFQAQPAASEQEIRISHQWAEAADGRDRAARVFAQEVRGARKGVKASRVSQLLAEHQSHRNSRRGNSIEMAVYPFTYAATKIPEFSLAGLPGLVPDLEAAQALKGSEIHARLQSLAEAHGIRILTWWWAPGGLFARNREISGPTSVRGLKVRGADPLFELMLREAGASVMNMPSTDIYPAMQAGALDAIATTYEAFMSLRLSEQAKFATMGTSLFMGFCPLVVSLTTWNRLTPDQKAAIEAAADFGSVLQFDRARP